MVGGLFGNIIGKFYNFLVVDKIVFEGRVNDFVLIRFEVVDYGWDWLDVVSYIE